MRPSRQHKQGAVVGLAVAAILTGSGLLAKDQITGGAATPKTPRAAQILVLINQRRVAHHLKPLKRDLVLASLARGHNRNMRSGGWFSHDDPMGQTFEERLRYLHRRMVGEVLAYGSAGFGTPKGLTELWWASPGHRRVLLTPGMRRVGVSVICGRYLNADNICLATADLSS